MIKKLALVLSLGVALSTLQSSGLSSVPLQPIIPDRQNTSNVLGLDDQLWDKAANLEIGKHC